LAIWLVSAYWWLIDGNGVRSATLWAGLLGLVKVVVEDVEFDEVEQAIVVSARPRKATKRRCGRCGTRCPGYD
jgi:transposase